MVSESLAPKRGGIRDELLVSIKCPQKACALPQPLLVKSLPEAVKLRSCSSIILVVRGRAIGTLNPISCGLTRLIALVGNSSRRTKNFWLQSKRKETPKEKPDPPGWSLSAGTITQTREKQLITETRGPLKTNYTGRRINGPILHEERGDRWWWLSESLEQAREGRE